MSFASIRCLLEKPCKVVIAAFFTRCMGNYKRYLSIKPETTYYDALHSQTVKLAFLSQTGSGNHLAVELFTGVVRTSGARITIPQVQTAVKGFSLVIRTIWIRVRYRKISHCVFNLQPDGLASQPWSDGCLGYLPSRISAHYHKTETNICQSIGRCVGRILLIRAAATRD